MFTVSIKDSQRVKVTVTGATDKKGNAAPVDGDPTFASADESVCTFIADPSDPKSGWITAVGPLASAAVVSIEQDADMGAGVVTITENGAVEITAGQATGLGVTVGTPEDAP